MCFPFLLSTGAFIYENMTGTMSLFLPKLGSFVFVSSLGLLSAGVGVGVRVRVRVRIRVRVRVGLFLCIM